MKRLLVFIITFIPFVYTFCVIAEESSDYVLFTFHQKLKGQDSDPSLESIYWIAEIDSIKELTFPISPVYIDSMSCGYLRHGINKDTIVWKHEWDSNFIPVDRSYLMTLRKLMDLNNHKRRKIQEIQTKWFDVKFRTSEDVKVYALPVRGRFVKSQDIIFKSEDKIYECQENLFIPEPMSDFSYIPDFWETQEGRIVEFANYIFVDFTSYNPWGVHYYNDRRKYRPIEKR